MTTSRIARPVPAELTTSQSELYAEITGGPRAQAPQHFALTDGEGRLNGPFNAFLLSPALGAALQRLGAGVRYSTDLDGRTRELAILAVAARWGSRFERMAHEGVGRAAGLTDDELAAVAKGRIPETASSTEADVLGVVAALLDGDIDDDDWARYEKSLGAPVIFELSTLVGYYATLALQLRVFRADDAS